MMNSIPSYVRAFNATSMHDAIHLADQALREENVTVAVWRNRVESFSSDEKQKIDSAIENILLADHHRLPCISGYGDFQMLDYRLHSPAPTIYSKKSHPAFDPNHFPFDDYVPLTSGDKSFLRWNFGSVTGGIRCEKGYNNTAIHQDPSNIDEHDLESQKLFYGVHTRFIENIQGSPTAFAVDDDGNDVYDLPQGAGAFFLTDGYLEKAAYHMATEDGGKLRLLQIIDLFPR
jgi:hypothetical protein